MSLLPNHVCQTCRRICCNAQEKQEADGDQVQEAVPAALQEPPADDGQEEWQLPSAGGLQRASWVTGFRADDLDEADAELDDLPETDYMVRDTPCSAAWVCCDCACEHARLRGHHCPYTLMSVLPGAARCWAVQLPG